MAWQFDLCGDHLALDFANTVSERHAAAPVERLEAHDDLLRFAGQAGLLAPAALNRLRRLAAGNPESARATHRRAVALRDALFGIFAAVAQAAAPPQEDLGVLNRELSRLVVGDDLKLGWRAAPDDLDGFLGAVVLAALALVTDPEQRSRVRLCDAPDCLWLFYDGSRNRSRRWCDMRQCGNRMKARRHYARGQER